MEEPDVRVLAFERFGVGRQRLGNQRHELSEARPHREGPDRLDDHLLGAHEIGTEASGVDADREPPKRPGGADGVCERGERIVPAARPTADTTGIAS